MSDEPLFPIEVVELAAVKPHPRNYRQHHDEQLDHLVASLDENGVYKNFVLSSDDYILAGHGIVKAMQRKGLKRGPAMRMPFDHTDPRALKIMVGDNEVGGLAEVNDRLLTEILRSIKGEEGDEALAGTGYDAQKLALLAMVTRPEDEIKDFDAAAEWVGMPEFDSSVGEKAIQLVVSFRSAEDRDRFIEQSPLDADDARSMKDGRILSAWWPHRERDDVQSLELTDAG